MCFKYLVSLSVVFLWEIISSAADRRGAVHNNESWMEAAISSPATEISCGVFRSVSGRLSRQYELIISTRKVEIYVIAKSGLFFAFPTPDELPDAGWPRAAEHPAFGRTCPATVPGRSLPSTHVWEFSLRMQRDTWCFAWLWAGGIPHSEIRFHGMW